MKSSQELKKQSNTNKNNSRKAVEGTLCKLFGFKRITSDWESEWLEVKIKCKDFNVIITVEDLETMALIIETKNKLDDLEAVTCKYNFNKLKQWVTRYKSLK